MHQMGKTSMYIDNGKGNEFINQKLNKYASKYQLIAFDAGANYEIKNGIYDGWDTVAMQIFCVVCSDSNVVVQGGRSHIQVHQKFYNKYK